MVDSKFDWQFYANLHAYFKQFPPQSSGSRIRALTLTSYSAHGLLPSSAYDFVYVDGNHSTVGVMSDALLAWRVLKVNGVVIFDDYGGICNVKVALDAFIQILAQDAIPYSIVSSDYLLALCKLPGATGTPLDRTGMFQCAA